MPHVHGKVVSFARLHEKKTWDKWALDMTTRDTFSSFYNTPTQGRNVRLALFTVPVVSRAEPDWNVTAWHSFALALVKKAHAPGKVAVIWDCDPRPVGPLARTVSTLSGKQQALVGFLRTKITTTDVWYNTDNSASGQDLCLSLALMRIREWAAFGNQPFAGPSDPRVFGCVLLSR